MQYKQEMRFLTKRLRDKDEEDVVIGDWKFAAMVIDRCYSPPPPPRKRKIENREKAGLKCKRIVAGKNGQ